MAFTGFTQAAQDFLWGIRMNNEKGWFEQHKKEYLEHVYEPLHAFTAELWELMEMKYHLGASPRVTRIYRDARRLHGHGPYKHNMWMTLRRPELEWTQTPVFYFELRPEGCEYGMGCYSMSPLFAENFRKRIDANPAELASLVDDFNKQDVFTLQGQSYKRPKGDPGEPLFSWYNKRELNLSRQIPWGRELKSKRLAQNIAGQFGLLVPLYEYFFSFAGIS